MITSHHSKSLLAAVTSAVLLVAGCSSSNGPSGSTTGSTKSNGNPYGLIDPGTLTITTDVPSPPYEYYNTSHVLVGFDAEMFKALAAKLGLKPRFVLTTSDLLFTTVSAQKADIGGGGMFGYAPSNNAVAQTIKTRKKLVQFTIPYASVFQSVIVNTQVAKGVNQISDLSSKDTCAVQPTGGGTDWSRANLTKYGVQFRIFRDQASIPPALETGAVDCWADAYDAEAQLVAQFPSRLKIIKIIDSGLLTAYFVAHGNPKLLNAVNTAMKELFQDGTYTRLFKQYFPGQKLQNPMTLKIPT